MHLEGSGTSLWPGPRPCRISKLPGRRLGYEVIVVSIPFRGFRYVGLDLEARPLAVSGPQGGYHLAMTVDSAAEHHVLGRQMPHGNPSSGRS